jgi:hypothetical protein
MYKKPAFWIVFFILVVISTVFCLKNFSRIMSFINLNITMDRQQALQSALSDSQKWSLGPSESRQAVIFDENTSLQFYIELEAGGMDVYNSFLETGKYQPYRWIVRHFIPGEEHQVYFYYTPAGELYGFNEIISEIEPGYNVSTDDARIIAENAAAELGVPLAEFQLIESAKNQVISGRIDHTFVYEREEKIGEARYRFVIQVSGEHVSKLYHTVKIPEAFLRRFSEMRSANNTIAGIAQYAMLFLYGLLGIGLGSFYLLRSRFILYRQALLWAFIVALLGFLASFNSLPLSWIWYDTAISTQAHITQNIMMSLLQFVQNFFLIALSFIVAESLTRLAFPSHIRFWKTLSPAVAPSTRILGNTVAGYGLVAINLAYVLGFYLLTSRYLGWWNPAGLQVNPNFIAMPLPWLSVLANSLHAGFWEEALFRAIPLAGMVLIGRRLKKERLFLILGIIIQAIIFGAGHANYAAQPAYARVFELIVPSLLFAFLYLRFGLYPAIILHFSFDAVLMAMYIWIMNAKGIWFSRLMVVAGVLLPLMIILFHRLKKGKWINVSSRFLNKYWKPAPPEPPKILPDLAANRSYNPKTMNWLIIFAIIGSAGWLLINDFTIDQPQMNLKREQAIEIASQTLKEQNISLDDNWRIDAVIKNPLREADKLVWQQGRADVYHQAIGSFIAEPVWEISFRTFSGEVADRAESYNFSINSKAQVVSYDHALPENTSGADLLESDARNIAQNYITDFFQLEEFALTEIRAEPSKLPARTDWNFVYKDTINYSLETGEFRYNIRLSGSKVMSVSRYTYVPEEWSRAERNRTRPVNLFESFAGIVYILFFAFIAIIAVIAWSNHHFNFKIFYLVLWIMIISTLLLRLNQWQRIPAGFSTAQPWNNQVLQYVLGSITHVVLLSFIFALLAGFLASWYHETIDRLRIHNVILAALCFGGFSVIPDIIKPDYMPWRPALNFLADFSPLLTIVFQAVSQWLTSALLLIFVMHWLKKITANGENRRFITLIIFTLFIFFVRHENLVYYTFHDFAYLALVAIILGAVLYKIFRHLLVFDLSLLPLFVSLSASLPLLRNALANPWQGALVANLLAIITINCLAFLWLHFLRISNLQNDVQP